MITLKNSKGGHPSGAYSVLQVSEDHKDLLREEEDYSSTVDRAGTEALIARAKERGRELIQDSKPYETENPVILYEKRRGNGYEKEILVVA